MGYETDPDVAAFLGGPRKAASADVAPKKSSMSGQRPDLQPDSETDYSTDPDVSAFLTSPKLKNEKPQSLTTQALQKAFEMKQQIKPTLASIGDVTIGGIIPAVVGGATYAGARAIGQTPEQATKTEQGVVSTIDKPFGKALGVAQSPAYQNSAAMQMMDYVSKNIGKGADWIAQQTGLPVSDVQNMINTSMVAVPEAGKTIAKPVVAAVKEIGKNLPEVRVETVKQPGQGQSVGAAAAVPESVIKANIDAAVANASPELQSHIAGKNPNSVNVPALETKTLEEKHGVNLTTGQRTGDTQLYSQEWNRRGETEALGNHFNEQPAQVANAFELSKQRHAPDIPSTADASELGQHTINALAEKDAVRLKEINSAYKALEEANGGQFPIDITALQDNIKHSLQSKMKTNHLSSAIASDLQEFYANPTFEAYEALRTNLANEMRSSSNSNARGAAYVVRQELENLPVFGENTGTPQAIQLKALADKARALHRERQEVLKSNPAYRAAVKEAASLEEAASQGESLNAEKFHKKYVAGGTPEAIRRMKAEIGPDNIANQAIAFSELERAKNAAVNASGRNLTPEQFAKFYKNNKSVLRETLSPEAMQDVTELGLLTSKIGMPKTGTFNYSNTYSGMLADMAKQGLMGLGEAKLAAATGGASIPAVSLTRQFMQKMNKEGFAKEAMNPYGGLTKD